MPAPVSGDDREALIDLLMSDVVMRTNAMGRDYAAVEADAILAAGFSRSPAVQVDAATLVVEALRSPVGDGQ